MGMKLRTTTTKRPDVVAHSCNPSTQETEVGARLSYIVRKRQEKKMKL
jgi:hypothetical protein